MDGGRPLRCHENAELVAYLLGKRREMAESSLGLSENLDLTLSNALRGICAAKSPIATLKDLSAVKGVGKWILTLMKGFFPNASCDASPSKPAAQSQPDKKGKKIGAPKGPKRYVPQKNSVAYALLISLYRGIASGSSFMRKQELIDAAEASGLSRTAIGPDKGKGKPGQFGSSAKDWYTGWSCMKTLITKGLVAKSSCPSKYMLTQEGQEAALECMSRSNFVDTTGHLIKKDGNQNSFDGQTMPHLEFVRTASADQEATSLSMNYDQVELNDTQIHLDAVRDTQRGRAEYSDSDPEVLFEESCPPTLISCTTSVRVNKAKIPGGTLCPSIAVSADSVLSSFNLRACTTSDVHPIEGDMSRLAMPPYGLGAKFDDTYDVILILDDRENFGSRLRKVVDNIRSQFNVLVEVRRLPVGDAIWIVRHKKLNKEYVLDFIVERKKVDDLCSSIRDNRYRDQKLRLQRCGLQKLIYLVEGDPNSLEAAESIKTACFTTEILEGFDLQRTSGLMDTVRKYGHLTKAISQYYSNHFSSDRARSCGVCLSFEKFVQKCQDLEKMTVSDVFALQLMQVPQVTEEIAIAVTALYPTLLSLARAYSQLEGDVRAQEAMLKNQSKMISVAASRNIFNLVWGG